MSIYLPNIQITYAISPFSSDEFSRTSIIIGTIDTFDSYQSLIDFSQVEMVIIDEIDTMIIREDYRQNLLNLMDNLSNNPQILVYSSTLSEQVMNYTNELIPNSILVKQRADKQRLTNIEQFYVRCENEKQKFDVVNLIIQQFNQTQIIVFCADDQITEQLYAKFTSEMKNE